MFYVRDIGEAIGIPREEALDIARILERDHGYLERSGAHSGLDEDEAIETPDKVVALLTDKGREAARQTRRQTGSAEGDCDEYSEVGMGNSDVDLLAGHHRNPEPPYREVREGPRADRFTNIDSRSWCAVSYRAAT